MNSTTRRYCRRLPLNVHQNKIRARGFTDIKNKDYFNINNIFESLYLKSIWGKHFPTGYFMTIFFIIIFITSNTLAKKIKWTVSQYTSTSSAGNNKRRSKRFCSMAVLCISFTWYVTEGPNIRDQIVFCAFNSFIVEVQTNSGYIHCTCDECMI